MCGVETFFVTCGVLVLLEYVFRGACLMAVGFWFALRVLGIWAAYFIIKSFLFAGFALRAFRNIPKHKRSWSEFVYKVREI